VKVGFLVPASLERDALLDMSEQVLSQPGISISSLRASPAVIRSARNAGLIQAATVHSSSTGSHLLALIEEHTDLKVRIVIPPGKS
jgi:hypothetical protein